MDVGLGGFTGSPFGFTGTRVPAASAFLCSRWIFAFLEIGIVRVVMGLRCDVDVTVQSVEKTGEDTFYFEFGICELSEEI
jgi:hypothetical protein